MCGKFNVAKLNTPPLSLKRYTYNKKLNRKKAGLRIAKWDENCGKCRQNGWYLLSDATLWVGRSFSTEFWFFVKTSDWKSVIGFVKLIPKGSFTWKTATPHLHNTGRRWKEWRAEVAPSYHFDCLRFRLHVYATNNDRA